MDRTAIIRSAADPPPPPWRDRLSAAYRAEEAEVAAALVQAARLPEEMARRVHDRARALVESVRANRAATGGIDAFMAEYDLSTQEGLTLMCLAEALLRVPDAETADSLIRDKIVGTDWERHLGHSRSIFVNASTLGLMITGRVLGPGDLPADAPTGVLRRLVSRLGEPVIRQALRQAMRIMGRQFVLGRDIGEAMERARTQEARGYRLSYDMLGEAARTEADARRYLHAYETAIDAIGAAATGVGPVERPGLSVKLSALHPRYEPAKRGLMLEVLGGRLLHLARLARRHDIGLCVDAEEAERLELSLEIFERLALDPSLAGWDGLGLAVQAYQKRAPEVISLLADVAGRGARRLPVRLVKGAYWDTEIKRSQEAGLTDYPVFTRKVTSDVAFIACARRLFEGGDRLLPQFATHNAHTAATVIEMADGRPFEFQRLHGMGEELFDAIVPADRLGLPCRIYAPVGGHAELLSYLVRRLLENGANSSFVNRLVDDRTPVETIIADPVDRLAGLPSKRHPLIPLPPALYGPKRRNARGLDLTDTAVLDRLAAEMEAALERPVVAGPIVGGVLRDRGEREARDPADRRRRVGVVTDSSAAEVAEAMTVAEAAFAAWSATPPDHRARLLERVADLMEARLAALMALCLREAGKTLPDAVAEVREAVDFLRYYADRARLDLQVPVAMPDAAGRAAQVALRGRGVFLCISPWNFPLAIFTGQVAAALAAGNTVVAKPAEQTPLIATLAVALFHEAGVPGDVLHVLPGRGETVGAALAADRRVAGVAFTGSGEVARLLARTLAASGGGAPLIAETGGLNAMIVDSSALPEQVVRDVVISAFGAAGQRCSALRVLCLQEDVADGMIAMLTGAMQALSVGDPALLSTDIGPVIDDDARDALRAHARRMDREARLIHACDLPDGEGERDGEGVGCFFAPRAYEISHLGQVEGEVFGPILHVLRYPASGLDALVRAVGGTGYGLTMGIHTRIDRRAGALQAMSRVGNTYVNRSMIGAVVGVQPFGGEGLSGTGPKAGGPRYVARFARPVVTLGSDGRLGANLARDAATLRPADLPPPPPPPSAKTLGEAVAAAAMAFAGWSRRPAADRAALLDALAEAVAREALVLAGLLYRDAGASLEAAAGQVRAAEVWLRHLATTVRAAMAAPDLLPGPTGEHNEIQLHGRGVVLCVIGERASLALALAQVGAALGAGNTVVAAAGPALAAALSRLAPVLAEGAAGAGGGPGVATVVAGAAEPAVEEAATDRRVAIVALCGGEAQRGRLAAVLASRPGPLVPLIDEPFGPRLLDRFVVERTLTIDRTAAGGNATLLTLAEDAADRTPG